MRYAWYGQMSPWQMLPRQMSQWQWQYNSVQNGPRNLPLKFGSNRVSNSWDITDIEFLWVVGWCAKVGSLTAAKKSAKEALGRQCGFFWYLGPQLVRIGVKKCAFSSLGTNKAYCQFLQESISNWKDIHDIDKCRHDKCCLDKCHSDSINLFKMVLETYL